MFCVLQQWKIGFCNSTNSRHLHITLSALTATLSHIISNTLTRPSCRRGLEFLKKIKFACVSLENLLLYLMDFNSFLNILFSQALLQGHQDIDKAIVDIPNIYNYWRKNNQIFQLIFLFFVLFISLAFFFIRPTSDLCLVLSVFSRLFECCSNCWICQSC